MVICDQWSLLLLKKKTYSLKVLMKVSSFSNEVFLFKVYTLFLKNNPLAHLKDYSIA